MKQYCKKKKKEKNGDPEKAFNFKAIMFKFKKKNLHHLYI